MADDKKRTPSQEEIDSAKLKLAHIQAVENLNSVEAGAYAKENGITLRTIYRWKRRYAKKGFDGLVRIQRGDKGKYRACSEVMKRVIEAKYLQSTRPSIQQVFQEIKLLQNQQGLRCPSVNTVRRIINDIPQALKNSAQFGKNGAQDTIPQMDEAEIARLKASRRKNSTYYPKLENRPVLGDRIDFPGLFYAPVEEHAVIYLFGLLANELGFEVEAFQSVGIDCEARRRLRNGKWQRVRIEFEYKSSNFEQHGHNPADCDLVVCWEHDWFDCPLEVIELKNEIQELSRRKKKI